MPEISAACRVILYFGINGILNISQPYRSPQPATGIALLLLLLFHISSNRKFYFVEVLKQEEKCDDL
jgi:hypothetical protein